MTPYDMQIFGILWSIIQIIVVLIVLILLGRINHYAKHILQELRKDAPPEDLRVKCSGCGNAIPRGAIQYIKDDPFCPLCHAQKQTAASTTK